MQRLGIHRILVAVALCLGLNSLPAAGQRAGEGLNPTVQEHVVEPGDTLWDLCDRILGSPWLWPRVWSFNPEITNPHWIFPGDLVRFYPSDAPLPSRDQAVAVAREFEEIPPEDNVDEEPIAVDTKGKEIAALEPITYKPPEWRANAGLFVTEKELEEAGTIVNAAEGRYLISRGDTVYLRMDDEPANGNKFIIFRTLAHVRHPRTKKKWGYMTQITGVATITGKYRSLHKAHIDRSFTEIERGHYVAPYVRSPIITIKPKPSSQSIDGVVLAIQYDAGVIAGQNQIVFVDKGAKDGLEQGIWLNVFGPADPLAKFISGNDDPDVNPEEYIGRVIVLESKEDASTCLVVDTSREIEVGYRFATAKSG